jgi:DNA primase large subunit
MTFSTPVLAEIEAASVREMTFEGIRGVVQTQCDKYLPMHSKGTTPEEMDAERMKDHISHFSLRLAFCQS